VDEKSNKNSDVSKATHLFLALCILFTLSLLIWAAVGKLDIVSMAEGEVIPSTKVKPVEHLEGGIVLDILAREGDLVQPGQELIVLERTIQGSGVQEIEVRVASLAADVARLEAEVEGLAEPNFSQELRRDNPALVSQALELFKARRARLESKLAGQREGVIQLRKEVERITARQRHSRNSFKLLQKEVALSAELLKDQLTTEFNHIKLQREANSLRSKIEEDQAALAGARSALKEGQEDLGNITHAYQAEAQEELRKSRRELNEFAQRKLKYSDSLDRTVIRSPVEGVVKALSVFSPGEVVGPGETIMQIVPSTDKLVVEAHLPIQDIGYVQVGQPAKVKLASLDARRFGTLEGAVATISPDSFSDENGQTFYTVRVETDKPYFEGADAKYNLYPGMLVAVSIHTGRRTVLEYLLSPFVDSLSMAMRER
jgi:membrane fusion protein, adhesin transport system